MFRLNKSSVAFNTASLQVPRYPGGFGPNQNNIACHGYRGLDNRQFAATTAAVAVPQAFGLSSKNGVSIQVCSVQQGPKAALTCLQEEWKRISNSATTWLSAKDLWSATLQHDGSLILRNHSDGSQQLIPRPAASQMNKWHQIFLHDGGIALLAASEQQQQHCSKVQSLELHLWRQLSSSNQPDNVWVRVASPPALGSSEESTIHAEFAELGSRGLQLCIAHIVLLPAGVLQLSVLQQSVFEPWISTAHQALGDWRSILLMLPGSQPTCGSAPQEEQQHQHQQLRLSKLQLSSSAVSQSPSSQAEQHSRPTSSTQQLACLVSWHPDGSQLAVAVSRAGSAWVVIFISGLEHVQECCWSRLTDHRATGLLHSGPCRICSIAWLPNASDALAVIDSHGRLCILSGGQLEKLQLIDTEGMTVTLKPSLQLHFSTLLAATGSQTSAVSSLSQTFLLAVVPPSNLHCSSQTDGKQQRLAIWDGRHLLVYVLHEGVDPSQHCIDQSVAARVRLLYGKASSKQMSPLMHQEQQLIAEEQDRVLAMLVPEPWLPANCSAAASTGKPLVQGCSALLAATPMANGVFSLEVAQNPLLNSQNQLESSTSNLQMDEQQQWPPWSGPQKGSQLEQEQVLDAVSRDSLLWLLSSGDSAFLAGRWQDSEDAYRQAMPLAAGHMVSVLLCQYRLKEALAVVQQLLLEVTEASATCNSCCIGPHTISRYSMMAAGRLSTAASSINAADYEEPHPASSADDVRKQEQQDLLQFGRKLAGVLAGLTADVLLAAVRAGSGATSQAAGLKLPCIFPTPMHWTTWFTQPNSQQQQVQWELTAGMAVELIPGAILAAFSQQLGISSLQDAAQPATLHTLCNAVARATGLLLLSEVLAAEAEGSALPEDVPELLADAVASTALPAVNGNWFLSMNGKSQEPGVFMWQQAAVLACSCSRFVRELQMSTSLADAFDDAARSALWRHLVSEQSQPILVLAQQAVAVSAVAATLWPAHHPCLRQLISKVLQLLCRSLALRVQSLPVLPAARFDISANLQHMLLQVLLHQALPESMAAIEQQRMEQPAVPESQPQVCNIGSQGSVNAHTVTAVLGFDQIRHLLQPLQAMQLKAGDCLSASDLACFAEKLAAADAEFTAESWAPHLAQLLVSAGLLDSVPKLQQQQQLGVSKELLAELSGVCDVQLLTSAVLLVAQVATSCSTTALLENVQQCWSGLAAVAAAPCPEICRVQAPPQEEYQSSLQQQPYGTQEACQYIANVAWLMHCREQVGKAACEPPHQLAASYAVALAAADGVHKPSLVQQSVLSILADARVCVTQQHFKQVQAVFDSCCGGALPRTADQLQKLMRAGCRDGGQSVMQQQEQHWQLQSLFLQDLLSGVKLIGQGGCSSSSGCLPAALHAIHQNGNAFLQHFKQAVPGLQACFVHPLAEAPEPSATTAKPALTALLLGTTSMQTAQKQQQLQPAVDYATALSADTVQLDIAEAAPSAESTVGAAASLRAAATAWQQQRVSALRDACILQDASAMLCNSSIWSLGSFLAERSICGPGRSSIRSLQLCNPAEFEDFLADSKSFTMPAAPQWHMGHAAAATGSRAVDGAATSGELAAQHSTSQRRWYNPLAALSGDLEPFYASYSPAQSPHATSPSSQTNAVLAKQQRTAIPQVQRSTSALSSPGSLQSASLSPPHAHSQQRKPSPTLGRLDCLHDSAPGSMRASPHSTLSPGQFSPLHQHLLRRQSSAASHTSRARSLSLSHSSEVWGMVLEHQQQRKSSFGLALSAISAHAVRLSDGSTGAAAEDLPEAEQHMSNGNAAGTAVHGWEGKATDDIISYALKSAPTSWQNSTGMCEHSSSSIATGHTCCQSVVQQPSQETSADSSGDGHAVVRVHVPVDFNHTICTPSSTDTHNLRTVQLQCTTTHHTMNASHYSPSCPKMASLTCSPVCSIPATVSASSTNSTNMVKSPGPCRQGSRRAAAPSPKSIYNHTKSRADKSPTITRSQCLHQQQQHVRGVVGGPGTESGSWRSATTNNRAAAQSGGSPTTRRQRHAVGEGAEHSNWNWSIPFTVRTALDTPYAACSSSNVGSSRKSSRRRRWLCKLQQACRWPGASASLQPRLGKIQSGRCSPRPLAEGKEHDGTTCSSTHAAAAVSACSAADPAAEAPALWSARQDTDRRGTMQSVLSSASSTPHALAAGAQQPLDEMFKAHLPEFINILSQGLSPAQAPFMGTHGLGIAADSSPPLQRSVSAAELSSTHPSDGTKTSLLLLSAENAASLWTQALPDCRHCRSSSSSTGSITVAQSYGTPDQQRHDEAMSRAVADSGEQQYMGPLAAGAAALTTQNCWQGSVDEGRLARSHLTVSATAAVHIPALPANGTPGCSNLHLLRQFPPLRAGAAITAAPVLHRIKAIPVAEGAEETDGTCIYNADSCGALSQQQQHTCGTAAGSTPNCAAASTTGNGIGKSASFDNIAGMMQLAHVLLRSTANPETAGNRSLVQQQNSTGQHLDAILLHGSSSAHDNRECNGWQDPDAAVIEDYSELNLTDFMGCFSPVQGGSKQLSRVASMNAAAAASGSPGGIFARNTNSAIMRASSEVSSSSVPDMEAFWADSCSGDPSRTPSRQVSIQHCSPPCTNPSYTAQRQQQQQQEDVLAADAHSAPCSPVAAKALFTPSPSHKSMLLHGPSRLSWKSPAVPVGLQPAEAPIVSDPLAEQPTSADLPAIVGAATTSTLVSNTETNPKLADTADASLGVVNNVSVPAECPADNAGATAGFEVQEQHANEEAHSLQLHPHASTGLLDQQLLELFAQQEGLHALHSEEQRQQSHMFVSMHKPGSAEQQPVQQVFQQELLPVLQLAQQQPAEEQQQLPPTKLQSQQQELHQAPAADQQGQHLQDHDEQCLPLMQSQVEGPCSHMQLLPEDCPVFEQQLSDDHVQRLQPAHQQPEQECKAPVLPEEQQPVDQSQPGLQNEQAEQVWQIQNAPQQPEQQLQNKQQVLQPPTLLHQETPAELQPKQPLTQVQDLRRRFEQQQQQQQQQETKLSLKRMLFGRKSVDASMRSQELQQVILQEFRPLSDATSRHTIAHVPYIKHEQPESKKQHGFLSFLHRSSSSSGSSKTQQKLRRSQAVDGPASCPITPLATAGAKATATFQTAVSADKGQQHSATSQTLPATCAPVAADATTVTATTAEQLAAGSAPQALGAVLTAQPAASSSLMSAEQQQAGVGCQTPTVIQLAAVCQTSPELQCGTENACGPSTVTMNALSTMAQPGSPALEVLADSMQRIVGVLEGYFSTHPPASATASTAATGNVQAQLYHSLLRPLAAAGTGSGTEAAPAGAPHLSTSCTVDSACTLPAAAAASSQAMNTIGTQTPLATWSPAATAAKARMKSSKNASLSGAIQPQLHFGPAWLNALDQEHQEHASSAVASIAEAEAGMGERSPEDGCLSWLHPSCFNPDQQHIAGATTGLRSSRSLQADGQQQEQPQGVPARNACPVLDGLPSLQLLAVKAAGSSLLQNRALNMELQAPSYTEQAAAGTGSSQGQHTISSTELQNREGSPSRHQQQLARSPNMSSTAVDIKMQQGQASPEGHSQEQEQQHSASSWCAAAGEQCMLGGACQVHDQATWQKQLSRHLLSGSAARMLAATAGTASRTLKQEQQQQWPAEDTDYDSCSEEDKHSALDAGLDQQFVLPTYLETSVQNAATQLWPLSGQPWVGLVTSEKQDGVGSRAATIGCPVAVADVKLLQAENPNKLRLLRPAQLRCELPFHNQQRQQLAQQQEQPMQQGTSINDQSSAHVLPASHIEPSAFDSYQRTLHSECILVRFATQQQLPTLQPPPVLRTLQRQHAQSDAQQQADRPNPVQEQQLWSGGLQQSPAAPWSTITSSSIASTSQAATLIVAPTVAADTTGISPFTSANQGLTAGVRAARLLQSLQCQQATEQATVQPCTVQPYEPQQTQAPWQNVAASAGSAVAEAMQQAQQPPRDAAMLQQGCAVIHSNKSQSITAARIIAAPGSEPSPDDSTATQAVADSALQSMEVQQQQRQQLARQPLSPFRRQLARHHQTSMGSSAKSNPSRSPRKAGSVDKKWVLLQRLKARNRSLRLAAGTTTAMSAPAATMQQQVATAGNGSTAADSLVAQLQGLMQLPTAASTTADSVIDTAGAVDLQPSSSFRPDLDAAAATALQGVLEQVLQVKTLHQHTRPAAGHQVQRHNVQGNTELAGSISLSELGSQHQQQPCGVSSIPHAESTAEGTQQPLLLPRMLSRAPHLDAEVQIGGALLQQQVLSAATQTIAAPPDAKPIELVLRVNDSQPGVSNLQQQQQPQIQQLQQQNMPLSPAALVALAAAAASAGAASAVCAKAPAPHLHAPTPALQAHTEPFSSIAGPAAAAPEQSGHKQGVLELAQLILGAFETAGGVITPECSTLTPDTQPAQGPARVAAPTGAGSSNELQQLDLLPNPVAGPAAPQFLQVVDYVPPHLQLSHTNTSLPLAGATKDEHPIWQQQHFLPAGGGATVSSSQSMNLGCCFAGCPERMSSPTFAGSTAAGSHSSKAAELPKQQGRHQRVSNASSGPGSADAATAKYSCKPKPASSQPQATASHYQKHQRCQPKLHKGTGREANQVQQLAGQQQDAAVNLAAESAGMAADTLMCRSSALDAWRDAQAQQLDQLWQQWQRQQEQVQQRKQQVGTSVPGGPICVMGCTHHHVQQENVDPNIQHSAAVGNVLSASKHADHQPRGQQHAQTGSTDHGCRNIAQLQPQQCHTAGAAATAVGSPLGVHSSKLNGADQTPNGLSQLSHGSTLMGAAAKKLADAEQQQIGQQHLGEEKDALDAAFARANAARLAAKAAAERAAAARRRRISAELQDLSKMLQEVDKLAAQIDLESTNATAMVEDSRWCDSTSGSAMTKQAPWHGASSKSAAVIQSIGSLKRNGDDLLTLREAAAEAATIAAEADALSMSLEGLGGVLSAATADGWYGT